MRVRGDRRQDLIWIAAFVAACLVLLGIRWLMSGDGNRASDAVPTAPATSVPPKPADSRIAALWGPTPHVPTGFADPDRIAPAALVTESVQSATTLTSWPDIGNGHRLVSLTGLLQACDVVDLVQPQCTVIPGEGTDPAKVAVLLGDSSIEGYWFTVRAALQSHGWTIVNFALSGCPAADVRLKVAIEPTTTDPAACDRHHAAYQRVVDRWKPSLVLVSDSESAPYALLPAGPSTTAQRRVAEDAYAEGLTRTLRTVSAPGRRVITLSPPPRQPLPTDCQGELKKPAQCAQPPYPTWFTLNTIQRAAAKATGTTYADLVDGFCHNLICPPVIHTQGGYLSVRGEDAGLAPEYAQFLGITLYNYLTRLGIRT